MLKQQKMLLKTGLNLRTNTIVEAFTDCMTLAKKQISKFGTATNRPSGLNRIPYVIVMTYCIANGRAPIAMVRLRCTNWSCRRPAGLMCHSIAAEQEENLVSRELLSKRCDTCVQQRKFPNSEFIERLIKSLLHFLCIDSFLNILNKIRMLDVKFQLTLKFNGLFNSADFRLL